MVQARAGSGRTRGCCISPYRRENRNGYENYGPLTQLVVVAASKAVCSGFESLYPHQTLDGGAVAAHLAFNQT